jgi:hypothetical protein
MPHSMTRPDPLLGSTDDDSRARLLDDTDVEILTGQLEPPDPIDPDAEDEDEGDEEEDGDDEEGVA